MGRRGSSLQKIVRARRRHAVAEVAILSASIAGQNPRRLHNSNPEALNRCLVRMIWTDPSRYRRPQRGPAAAMMAAHAQ
jgi:hypothetical protein